MRLRLSVLFTAVMAVCVSAPAFAQTEQTIVFFRHAEKMSGGYGQLTCQGLNRALALPDVLIGRFGRPDFLYAPDPTEKISEPAGSFYYVRPLATIEPTAIRARRSVNTHYGYTEIGLLKSLLVSRKKAGTTSFVAWEHVQLQKLVQSIMTSYGGGARVPAWISGDYDTLYIVEITWNGSRPTARFHREPQGLNRMSGTCP